MAAGSGKTFNSGSGTSNHDGPDETGRKGGNRAQPAEGEKDARGLTKDSTWMKDDAEAPTPRYAPLAIRQNPAKNRSR